MIILPFDEMMNPFLTHPKTFHFHSLKAMIMKAFHMHMHKCTPLTSKYFIILEISFLALKKVEV
jgi:hypothetical protein